MLKESPLGQSTVYIETYTPTLLYKLPRSMARDKISMNYPLPFNGVDIWNGYEFSWLNLKGKPQIGLLELGFSCHSKNIIESKSLKLYLNSFNQSQFASMELVQQLIQKDLNQLIEGEVLVKLYSLEEMNEKPLLFFSGYCLDQLDVETKTYHVQPAFLTTGSQIVEEKLYSDLLKSNCLATGQPDWGSLFIHYTGQKINHEGLLKYIISYRNHSGFAEHCVEQIFHDLLEKCQPSKLTVFARYTRRGGLDINPFRSNFEEAPLNLRQIRQ